jgi:outer membrane lipoprotein-sorting protein
VPADNHAIKMKLEPGKSEPPMQFKPGGKKIGTEKIDGNVCDIYLYPKKAFGMETKMWIWREKKIPLKAETEFTTTEYKNISFEDIPSSEFQLPKGVQITEMKP